MMNETDLSFSDFCAIQHENPNNLDYLNLKLDYLKGMLPKNNAPDLLTITIVIYKNINKSFCQRMAWMEMDCSLKAHSFVSRWNHFEMLIATFPLLLVLVFIRR